MPLSACLDGDLETFQVMKCNKKSLTKQLGAIDLLIA
jgi:hypothetical protein